MPALPSRDRAASVMARASSSIWVSNELVKLSFNSFFHTAIGPRWSRRELFRLRLRFTHQEVALMNAVDKPPLQRFVRA